MAEPPTLTIHGARGSSPVSGPATMRYGGHTTCIELAAPGAPTVLIDAGSGLLDVEPRPSGDYTVLFTHFHWDHIQGLPFFLPLLDATSRWRFVGRPPEGMSIADAVGGPVRPPWFPVTFDDMHSGAEFAELPEGALTVGPFTFEHVELRHPGGVVAYRVTTNGASVVVATDVEQGDPDLDRRLHAFARGADVLIHDAQYTPKEHASSRRGWGHSTWEHAVATASAAGVSRLILTSHDPRRTDAQVDEIVERARASFPCTDGAHAGMRIFL